MDQSRRKVIAGTGVVVGSLLGGCSSIDGAISPLDDSECDSPIILMLEQIPESAENHIRYDELTDEEKEMVDTAISQDEFRDCAGDDYPEYAVRFRDRILEPGGETPNYYLRKSDDFYGIEYRLFDGIYTYASSTPVPG